MANKRYVILALLTLSFQVYSKYLIQDVSIYSKNRLPQAVVEISSGTNEKWEVDKITSQLYLEQIHQRNRIIQYLAYPANYGFFPQTLVSKSNGGDGDPLDVLILGHSLDRGSIHEVRIIGILQLLDDGEKDDKIIAIIPNSVFDEIYSMKELQKNFPGIDQIIKIWFENYKGKKRITVIGYKDRDYAVDVLINSLQEFTHDW